MTATLGKTPAGQRTRLLQVTSELTIGGLERVVETLTRTIDPERFEVAVACLREKGYFADELEAKGYQVHLLRSQTVSQKRLGFFPLARLMREWRPTVVHTHNTEAFIHGSMAAISAGVRTLVHTDHARAFPDKHRYIFAERVASEFAYRVVGVSDDSTRNLRRYVRIPSRKLVTIENGVDAAPFEVLFSQAEARASFGLDAERKVIGLAARLEEQKGVNYLLDALPAVFKAFPECSVMIAGTGSQSAPLRAQAESLGLSGDVRFLGDVHDIPRFLRTLDLFLIPSVWEGLPMALLEAMAAECPIVSTSVGGIPSVLSHGESGWLVPPQDTPAFAAGVVAMLSDSALRTGIARAAKRTFHERYSAEAMTARYEGLYLRQATRRRT